MADLSNKLETLLQRQEEVADNIAKIKEAIYHPDQGLFTSIREIGIVERKLSKHLRGKNLISHSLKSGELRLAQVEATVGAIKKIQWLVIGSAVTTLTALAC
jgi:phosphate uptake regulator